MTAASAVVETAGFTTAGTHSRRFRMVCEPATGQLRGHILLAHAFAEEMNKTRRMCSLLSRRLAGAGWRVVRPDLRGCGDSAGEFGEAAWQDWIDDLAAELAELPSGHPTWLWGVRAGALLAPELLRLRPDLRLLLWQPVLSGSQHLQQFLRLHAGARIVGSGKPAHDTPPLQRLRAGQTVEVGGYDLAPSLAGGIEKARFDIPTPSSGTVVWFELATDASPTVAPAVQAVADRLRSRGVDLQLELLQGLPFWQTQEIEQCDALIERSAYWLERRNAG
jgi:exosortase A-associated hydrolase 2